MQTRQHSLGIVSRAALAVLVTALCGGLAAQEFTLESRPRSNLEVRVEGAGRNWEVRPVRMTDRFGANLRGASEADFVPRAERWERTGRPMRYDNSRWQAAFETFLGENSPPGARFYFYARNPSRPILDPPTALTQVDGNMFSVEARRVSIVGYPQTWLDVFEGYVNQFSGEERQQAVRDWEEAHREIILNEDFQDGWFTPEERNAFARFYQDQFVYIRDRNPELPSIYEELAAFHRERGNLDAELDTYLAALRADVPSPARERFALEVGSIFVERLQLYRPAINYLRMAEDFSNARYLLARCMLELKQLDDARAELQTLLGLLAEQPEGFVVQESTEAESGRALVALAELEFMVGRYDAALAAAERIARENPYSDAGRIQRAAVLLQRARPARGREPSDLQRARELIQGLRMWPDASRFAGSEPGPDIPLDPLMARALVITPQTDPQFSAATDRRDTPRQEVMRTLRVARALDPLSAEPWLAEGRLLRRLGRFREALATFQQGLDVNPQHPILHYNVADLHAKAGMISVAKAHLADCLKYAPDFAPALTLLGQIALADVDRIRETLLLRIQAGDTIDFAGELVPVMKEAVAFFSSSLAIKPGQPATRLALANLYLQMADVAPETVEDDGLAEQVRVGYLTSAREHALELIGELESFAAAERPQQMSEREIAAVPSLAAYNVLAYALYALDYTDDALAAFREHIQRSTESQWFATTAHHTAYQESSALLWAREWRDRINRNLRQFYEVDLFTEDSVGESFGLWTPVRTPRPDSGFLRETRITGGPPAPWREPVRGRRHQPHRTPAAARDADHL
jgi:tetratricopeptide (TPR) repeat protein